MEEPRGAMEELIGCSWLPPPPPSDLRGCLVTGGTGGGTTICVSRLKFSVSSSQAAQYFLQTGLLPDWFNGRTVAL